MGRSLRRLIDSQAPMRPAQAIGVAIQILEPLAALHQQGRAHGGIAPESIVVGRDRVELPAPAVRGDAAADVECVGRVLYELLTRTLPEPGAPPPSSRTPSLLGARLDAAVMRALDPCPAARFTGAGELLHELRVCLVDALGVAARARDKT